MLALYEESASQPTGMPTSVTLNLFDDMVLTAVIDQVAPTSSGYSLSGRTVATCCQHVPGLLGSPY